MAISRSQMRTQLTGDRMPAKSEKQRRYMAMAYNDPDMGVPKEVAKKFMKKPAQGYKKGGKMPDLTGDGKVTQADVLKGRGVFKAGGKVGYHRMPDGTMMKDSEHKMKKGGTVKKYMSGGRAEATKEREKEMMRKGPSRRPRLGPNREMERLENEAGMARQQDNMRNKRMEREAAGTAYKKGGKVRGCGMARGGAVRPCKMVKMKGS